jgi:peptidyl-prolyl cis-trans isomerase SurA
MVVVALTLTTAQAQNVQRIAAIVNDDAISVYDLLARLRMVILTSNLPDTKEARNSIAPRVLRSLIDERLQLQEARKLSIGVDDSEVAASIQSLETDIGVPEGGIKRILGDAGIPFLTLEDQVRAQIAWSKVVRLRLRPTVQVGQGEIETYLTNLRENLGKPEYRVGEIFLAVDNPSNEVAVRDRARQLAEEIRAGATFQALARQFSESASAAAGGDAGWVRPDQLQPELAAAVKTLEEGQLSDPIRSIAGYHLIIVGGQRNEELPEPVETVTLQQISLPYGAGASDADRQAQIGLAQTVGDVVTGCDDLEAAGREMGARVSQRLADLKVSDLAPAMSNAIAGLPEEQASRPIEQERDVVVVMVCERRLDTGLPSDAEVVNRLAREKLNLLARRYMRDIRNSAFLDVRV